MKVHYGNKLLTAALAILLNNQHAKAAQEINAADFIKQLPAISASTQPGLEPAYS